MKPSTIQEIGNGAITGTIVLDDAGDEAQIRALAEAEAEKVARISQAIADGSFRINAEAIADKLIANAQELLGKSSH